MIGRRQFIAGASAVLCAGPAGAEGERVVIAGASLVEIAFALGAGSRIVGVDRTATHPPQALERASIGYFRQLAPEGILALRPTLVIGAPDAGPERAFEILVSAGIRVVRTPDALRPREVVGKIRAVGHALGLVAEAEALVDDYLRRLDDAVGRIDKGNRTRRVLFVLAMQGEQALVGGSGTVPHEMIRAAGFSNAAAGLQDYQPVTPEGLVVLAPWALLMMPEHAARAGGLSTVLTSRGLRHTDAGRDARAMTMEGALLMRLGPRTPDALLRLATRMSGR